MGEWGWGMEDGATVLNFFCAELGSGKPRCGIAFSAASPYGQNGYKIVNQASVSLRATIHIMFYNEKCDKA